GIRDFHVTGVQTCALPISRAAAPERDTDVEAIQMHVGVRYLLLAPLFGYGLLSLRCFPTYSQLLITRDGVEREVELDDFHEILRSEERRVGKEGSARERAG